MFKRQAVGAFVIALALPAYADSPPKLSITSGCWFNLWTQCPYTVEQLSGSDVVELKPLAAVPISVRINANADVVYKTIGKLAGVTVVIDPDYRPTKITLALTNVTVQEALDMVARQSKTVWRAVTPNIMFVYPKDAP